MEASKCCVCVCVCRRLLNLGCKVRCLDKAGPDTPGPAGGREGCLEEGTGSALKGEEAEKGPSLHR